MLQMVNGVMIARRSHEEFADIKNPCNTSIEIVVKNCIWILRVFKSERCKMCKDKLSEIRYLIELAFTSIT